MFQLEVEKREDRGKAAARSRSEGKIPAVFYGPKEKATAISISARDFAKVWHEVGESTVIELSGVGDKKEALIHDVSIDVVSEKPLHVDFYIIEKGKKIQVRVPLEFEGVAPAIKDHGAILVKVLHELEIEVLPKDLPHALSVDISTLANFDSQIHVRDIKLPSDVKTSVSLDEVVALVTEAKKEEEEEITEEAPDLASIEVEKKGKQEGEEKKESGSGEGEEAKKDVLKGNQ